MADLLPFLYRRRQQKQRELERRRAFVFASAITSIGVAATIWYQSRLRRDEQQIEVADRRVLPPATLPDDIANKGELQLLSDGFGKLYYRRYSIDISSPDMDAAALMGKIRRDINTFTPTDLAHFKKIKGADDDLRVGDEFFIRITGPWNAWVRTISVTDTSFTFVTLKGHLEAGEIHFEVMPHPTEPDCLRFQIQSWARSRDSIIGFFYSTLGVAQIAQTGMWVTFAERVAQASGGEAEAKVEVLTAAAPYEPAEPLPAWKRYSSQIDRYREVNCNFDLERREDYTEANGWRIDDYAVELPAESPGQPFPGGAWEKAREVLENYEFPDPSIITGIFVPDVPLAERVMVLRARFLIFSFLFGVKISQVIDEERDDPKNGRARIWGYGYDTLEGHFEMGEITFMIWKFLDTGKVEFRIHAFSKTGVISNPFYRIGFTLFGRGLQTKFARTALDRMREFVIRRTAGVNYTSDKPMETVDVQSTATDTAAAEKLEQIAPDATAATPGSAAAS